MNKATKQPATGKEAVKPKIGYQSYRGARDIYPDNMAIQNYMFDTWKKTLIMHGFEQYEFPILEPLEIFAAKSGAEIVNDQLFWLEDKAGRKLAIRPELTPGTVRMIVQKYRELSQPIKWFMIGNNWRYEKPQLGRGREFNQLEVNIFGVDNNYADLEIFSIISDLMKAFGANETMFGISISDRRLVNALLSEYLSLDSDKQIQVRRLMDKWKKLTRSEIAAEFAKLGLEPNTIEKIDLFLNSSLQSLAGVIPQSILEKNEGYKNITDLFEKLKKTGLDKFCNFDPSIIRGFDYSDGLVYEVYDKNSGNSRSMFGGERFDKLAGIFGNYELPATGFAMGDYTLLEFLKNWKLLPEFTPNISYLVTVWPKTKSEDQNLKYFNASYEVSNRLISRGFSTTLWNDPNTKIEKQLKYADKKGIPFVIIIGETELNSKKISVKNLKSETQATFDYEEFFAELEHK